MQWLVTTVLFLVLLFGLPMLIVRLKARARRKDRLRGIGGAFDVGFSIFDPARARTQEVIEMRNEVGHADEGDQGELHKPPMTPRD